jgi:glycosyltransferase involved in cell wall biosynthesis
MGAEVTVVLVDNGEPSLERSLLSLRRQSIPVTIIVASGPKTNLKVARRYADKVMPPIEGIGKARVKAVLEAETEYIVSADSDTTYHEKYCEYALDALRKGAKAVKAGVILPLEAHDPLAIFESAFSLIPCYEFALSFKKSEALRAGLAEEEAKWTNPRMDIGWFIVTKLNALPDLRLVCYTRMPTNGARYVAENFVPSLLAGFTPVFGVAGIVLGASAFKLG